MLLQPENDYEMEDRKTKQTICLCSVVRFGGGWYVVVVTVPSFQVGNQTSKDNIALVMEGQRDYSWQWKQRHPMPCQSP